MNITLKQYMQDNLIIPVIGDTLEAKVKTINDNVYGFITPEFSKELWKLYSNEIEELAVKHNWIDYNGKYYCRDGLDLYLQIMSDDFNRDSYFQDMAQWTYEQLYADDIEDDE